MAQTRRDRKLRSLGFTDSWIVCMIRIKALCRPSASWICSFLLPQVHASHGRTHLPLLCGSDSYWTRIFSCLSCLQIWASCWGLVNPLQEGGSSCHAGKTDPFTGGRQADWWPVTGDLMRPSQNSSSLGLLWRYSGWWWLPGTLS